MDINDIRSIVTVASFCAFLGIVWWAYGAKRKASFDEAARLPFIGEEPAAKPTETRNGDQA